MNNTTDTEKTIARNVMAGRPQFDGLTAEEVEDYRAGLRVHLMLLDESPTYRAACGFEPR